MQVWADGEASRGSALTTLNLGLIKALPRDLGTSGEVIWHLREVDLGDILRRQVVNHRAERERR